MLVTGGRTGVGFAWVGPGAWGTTAEELQCGILPAFDCVLPTEILKFDRKFDKLYILSRNVEDYLRFSNKF